MSKTACLPCLSEEVKDLLAEAYPDFGEQLKGFPSCATGIPMMFCAPSKRGKSPYNEFVSACLLQKRNAAGGTLPGRIQDALKACAGAWSRANHDVERALQLAR